MNSKIAGENSKKSTRTKVWWVKLSIAFILSNILFFLLFSKSETTSSISRPKGYVELHLKARLLTPFQLRKRVLIIHRDKRIRVEAMLEKMQLEPEEQYTVSVREIDTETLLKNESWEIIPYLSRLTFTHHEGKPNHEIHY